MPNEFTVLQTVSAVRSHTALEARQPEDAFECLLQLYKDQDDVFSYTGTCVHCGNGTPPSKEMQLCCVVPGTVYHFRLNL